MAQARRSCWAGYKMDHAPSRPTIHVSFGHIYIHTIMMSINLVAATSFVILFLFSLHSWLCLRTTPFSAKDVGACTSSPCWSDTNPHSDYCTSTSMFHSMRAPSFSPSSDITFVFPAFALFFLPNLLFPPMVTVTSRPTFVDAGTGDSVLLLAFLCSCRWGWHGGACHT
jgi:hypothetical protein